jgi:hypothetical protein
VRRGVALLAGALILVTAGFARAQSEGLTVPDTVVAGSAFSVQSSGEGEANLYIVGPAQVLERKVQLGQAVDFPPDTLFNAGHYLVILSSPLSSSGGNSAVSRSFDVVPASQPAKLSFLAGPSRLPVSIHDAIVGAAYVFDAYRNLIVAPLKLSFELTSPSEAARSRVVTTHDGAAWTAMDSSSKEGTDTFIAKLGDVSAKRIVSQVAGDPCNLKMSVTQLGGKLQVETDPVRDCNGNAVADGTIVTFTETYNGDETTVDAPLKRGIAKVEMPDVRGATISVASGVSLGNQVRWEK